MSEENIEICRLKWLKIHWKTLTIAGKLFWNLPSQMFSLAQPRGIFKNLNFKILWIGKKIESTALDKHYEIPILNLWMNWEKLSLNLTFTVEDKMVSLHKIRLGTIWTQWIRYSISSNFKNLSQWIWEKNFPLAKIKFFNSVGILRIPQNF